MSTFWDQTPEQADLLVETPLDRYECCLHCPHDARHDGHVDACPLGHCGGHVMTGQTPASAEREAIVREIQEFLGYAMLAGGGLYSPDYLEGLRQAIHLVERGPR